MLNKLRKASSSHTQMYTDSTPFEVVLIDGDFSPQIEFDGFTTELRGKWLAKSPSKSLAKRLAKALEEPREGLFAAAGLDLLVCG